ncbi:hypothetical protein [Sedimenticola hydrogenitrophicus]|uniref:hypothetical protein n=1 Tax=Sedimenticola hydrogenitrophicus TaxID=2967975 RepID=UPI0023B0B500|nr:hypothetical protein [Sedimenticola hydrogenitrophicus]
MKRSVWVCLLVLLSGCQQPPSRGDDLSLEPRAVVVAPAGEGLQGLFDFSSRFQAHAPRDQLALCEELRQALEPDGDIWPGWYLATAITQVEGCGEPEEAIALINRVLGQRNISHEEGWLAYYQISLLRRQQQQRQQLQEAIAEQRKLKGRIVQLTESRRLLENQLRDLKRIETSINKRLDEKK